jgi:alkanesulfonate monooxygenase SsuD/methylene tetrahydromethanopterin reductase-like flavin-dependent oxidoreductase (luciferase family)
MALRLSMSRPEMASTIRRDPTSRRASKALRRVGKAANLMTDLGIHGIGTHPEGMNRAAHWRAILDEFPDVFSTAWISDHLQFEGKPLPEAWTFMTWLAATFPRLRIGSMVLRQSYRNPGLLGVMGQTLQELSGGRLILGLGAGWLEDEYRAFNYEFPRAGVRVAQLGETIELLKTLWTQSPARYQGESYRLDEALCARPDPPIPIMVGTNGPRALKVVAQLADWWVWDGPWETTYRVPYELLRHECQAIGRPFEDITLACELAVSLPDVPADFVPTYEHSFYPGQVFGIAGPATTDVIREIEQLVDVGVKHIALDFDDFNGIYRFVNEVIPNVRLEANPG